LAKKKTSRRRFNFSRVKRSSPRKMTIPLAVIAGLAPGITGVVTTAQRAGFSAAGLTAATIYTGYDYSTGKWSLSNMRLGMLPLAIGVVVHKVAGMIGINKAIASTGIPFIRI